jgi:hypothetical protein
MVNGLARLGYCPCHDLRVKCVDMSLFETKSGYSPMTGRSIPGSLFVGKRLGNSRAPGLRSRWTASLPCWPPHGDTDG